MSEYIKACRWRWRFRFKNGEIVHITIAGIIMEIGKVIVVETKHLEDLCTSCETKGKFGKTVTRSINYYTPETYMALKAAMSTTNVNLDGDNIIDFIKEAEGE
jgi:hypothetical protein